MHRWVIVTASVGTNKVKCSCYLITTGTYLVEHDRTGWNNISRGPARKQSTCLLNPLLQLNNIFNNNFLRLPPAPDPLANYPHTLMLWSTPFSYCQSPPLLTHLVMDFSLFLVHTDLWHPDEHSPFHPFSHQPSSRSPRSLASGPVNRHSPFHPFSHPRLLMHQPSQRHVWGSHSDIFRGC